MENREMTMQDKTEVQTQAEPTQEGPVFTPAVDIFENEEELVLVADMPGVSKDGVNIDLEDNQLRIHGKVETKTHGNPLVREYPVGDFMRSFTLSNLIDQSKIEANLKNGVLRVVLPKQEAAKPRKIAVKAV